MKARALPLSIGILSVIAVQVHNFVDRASNMGGGSGCKTTASTGLSPLLTSLLSHCSHGGNSFTAETFVNDGLSGHRRRRRPLSRSSLTKVSAVKHAPPCETMDHTRPFQLSLFSRWRGPRLLPENRPRRMLLKLLSPILHLLPVGGQINEIVNLHNCEGAQRRSNPDEADRAQSGLLRRCAPSQ